MTYYDVLGIKKTASSETIKLAYRKLAKDFHPDKSAGVSPAVARLVQEKFLEIQEAYEVLTNHRAEYDAGLEQLDSPAYYTPTPQPPEAVPTPVPPPPRTKPSGVTMQCCQSCGEMRMTKFVAFYRNVGMLFWRHTYTIMGNLCVSCVHKQFWKFEALDVVLGPWGMISAVVAPIYFIQNIFSYLAALYKLRGAERPDFPVTRTVAPKATPKWVGWIFIWALAAFFLWAFFDGLHPSKGSNATPVTATTPTTSANTPVAITAATWDQTDAIKALVKDKEFQCFDSDKKRKALVATDNTFTELSYTEQVNFTLNFVPACSSTSVIPTENIKQASFVEQQFGGIVHNQESNTSAEFGIIFQETGGVLSGCMGVKQPLFGSGPLSGHASDSEMSFAVTSAIGKITFVGGRTSDVISGTYKVEYGDRPTELGTFTLDKIKSNGPDVDLRSCPTDAEVHQQINGTISSQTNLEDAISSTLWKHVGANTAERVKVWITKDHFYESSEPWSGKNPNITASVYCDTTLGATAPLGPAGIYAGQCTYTWKWIKESATCTVVTAEIITTINRRLIVGWSQHVDSSPLTHTPATCMIAGVDGAGFSLEPLDPATPVVRGNEDLNTEKRRQIEAGAIISPTKPATEATTEATAKVNYNTNIQKRYSFDISPCYFGNIAMVRSGDQVQILSQKTRASGGDDIYEVRFQEWTGWINAAFLTIK
jgi:hypothetical protein